MATTIETCTQLLLKHHNMILHGVPGTGKTYTAKEIAAKIVTGDNTKTYATLSPEEKAHIELVQFHPNYDYTDFVEGIRPIQTDNGQIAFELKKGIFKKFVEDIKKSVISLENDKRGEKKYNHNMISEEFIWKTLKSYTLENHVFKLNRKQKLYNMRGEFIHIDYPSFKIIEFTNGTITVMTNERIGSNINYQNVKLKLNKLIEVLKNVDVQNIQTISEYSERIGEHKIQEHSYEFSILKEIIRTLSKQDISSIKSENFVFIIDEINRGEISKIFGELFSLLESDYRGPEHAIALQYQNLYPEDKRHEKFYIPKNVYIIGTMNDIDRSVDTFDFAMRRRFSFVEVTPEDSAKAMLKGEIKDKFNTLNKLVEEKLGYEYQLGASYFKNSNDTLEDIWMYKVKPLLREYSRGLIDNSGFEKFAADCEDVLGLSGGEE